MGLSGNMLLFCITAVPNSADGLSDSSSSDCSESTPDVDTESHTDVVRVSGRYGRPDEGLSERATPPLPSWRDVKLIDLRGPPNASCSRPIIASGGGATRYGCGATDRVDGRMGLVACPVACTMPCGPWHAQWHMALPHGQAHGPCSMVYGPVACPMALRHGLRPCSMAHGLMPWSMVL